ncbi:hypothetical protein J3R30DRAFT_3730778 [Lentinula aciculospora]|uniref:Uncharacterized protein n=1 Tax=Lentinula aciculospora TaxID=153920 RepID=A0A9W9AP82_9AGAR|nr:hypothetical protein J3R30DRAFT_3730778 [Lentinula aciculospora]
MSAPTSLLLLLHQDLPESSHQWEDLHDFQAANVACETARFVLEDDDILVRCETMDKNTTIEDYTQGQEDHPT